MQEYLFFMSYARLDYNPYLKRFYDDLVETVRQRTGITDDYSKLFPGITKENIGFFDGEEIELGAKWKPKLAEALGNSRVFVYLSSPTYFMRRYCGQEWQIFYSRVESHVAESPPGTSWPPVMMPVLWIPLHHIKETLPQAFRELQEKHDDFGKVYGKEGLLQLRKLKIDDQYERFLVHFADKLINAAKTCQLKPEQNIRNLEDVPSAFHQQEEQSQQLALASTSGTKSTQSGPRHVQFIIVAGRRNELQAFRKKVDAYGDMGGTDWRPYLPPLENYVDSLVQFTASEEGFGSVVESFSVELFDKIEQARKTNSIVVLVVDPWTLHVQSYKAQMAEYDKHNFLNCGLLVLWNREDKETKDNRSALEKLLQSVFYMKSGSKKDSFCILDVDRISTREQLGSELGGILNRIRSEIFEKADEYGVAEGDEIVSQPIIAPKIGGRA